MTFKKLFDKKIHLQFRQMYKYINIYTMKSHFNERHLMNKYFRLTNIPISFKIEILRKSMYSNFTLTTNSSE